MANRDQEHQNPKRNSAIVLFRNILFTVKIVPFICLLLGVVVLLLYNNVGCFATALIDMLLGYSVLFVVVLLCLSKSLSLCVWHKTACLLLLVPVLTTYVDNYIVRFYYSEIENIRFITLIAYIIFIIIGHRKVNLNGRKRTTESNT